MPNNILKDFFYGNINPNEKQFDRNRSMEKLLPVWLMKKKSSDPCWIRSSHSSR